MACIKSKD
jgi:hypothetical protein